MISVKDCRRKKCKDLMKVTTTSASEYKREYFCGDVPIRTLQECPREVCECRACNPSCDGDCEVCLKEKEEWDKQNN